MFFIGIFGIEQKNKVISTRHNIICPSCSAYGRYDVIMCYSYFHVFFIPLFKWNKQYFIQTHCCNKLCNLDYDIGRRIENGEQAEINSAHIHCHEFYSGRKYCPYCFSQLDTNFQYCPYCGKKL